VIEDNTSGATAEMLLQSHDDFLRLLPALPAGWPEGRVNGLCARDSFHVDIRWGSNRLLPMAISRRLGGTCNVRYGKTESMVFS
jgi:alpha-L-fucosidase 2